MVVGVSENLRYASVHRLRALTHKMLVQAQAGQWEALTQTEQERQTVVDEFFARPPAARDAELVVGVLQEMLDSDRQVVELGVAGRTAIADNIRKLRLGRRVERAYNEPTSDFR
jgi:hypothetical protein